MTITILITGHRGYIGSALFRVLSECNEIDNIIGYDLIEGDDILDYERLFSVMSEHRPDIVIHLAAITSSAACNADPMLAIRVNASGTYNVLNAMKEVGCEHIIFASASAVYGDNKVLPYKEDFTPKPLSPYGFSKLLGEFTIYNHYNLQENPGNYLIYRLFNIVGSSGYEDIDSRAIIKYDRLFSSLQSGRVVIYGNDYPTFDGSCERDFVSLKDTCNAFMKGIIAIGCHCRIRETINICSGNPSSIKWIVEVWNNIALRIERSRRNDYNLLPQIKYTFGSRRIGDIAKVCGSSRKAERVLGWAPLRRIEDIIYDLSHDRKF